MKVLLVADKANQRFYQPARASLDRVQVFLPKVHYGMASSVVQSCRKNKINTVITCCPKLLTSVLAKCGLNSEGSVQQWAGAKLHYDGVDFIVTRAFAQIVTTTTGRWIFRRHVYKHIMQAYQVPEMKYQVVQSGSAGAKKALERFAGSDTLLIAVDIETKRQPFSPIQMEKLRQERPELAAGLTAEMPINSGTKLYECCPSIFMVGYYRIFRTPEGKLDGEGVILDVRTMEDIYTMRQFNNLPAPKVTQNGGYEATYFIRYGSPLHNWLYDTYHMMHSWQVELPRTLDFIGSLFLPNFRYWKDLMDVDTYYYNAVDIYTTAWAWVLMIAEVPEWAVRNYQIEFRKCFPNITMGLEGFKVDEAKREELLQASYDEEERIVTQLERVTYPGFNPNSPKQSLALVNALSSIYKRKFKKTDKATMQKWADSHPLHGLIADLIKQYRECIKQRGFLTSRLFDSRFLYEINSGGTASGRSASKASNLWVGANIQNQSTKLRDQYVADDGWELSNGDGSQAESRTTAYLSQDANLMHTVETAKDFHTRNASGFFGIPEEEISKEIRTLSKRVNHGANYNMAEFMLIQTMGHKNIMQAKQLLKLPDKYTAFDTAKYLLGTFSSTYPDVKGRYYDEIIEAIRTTKLLTIPNGWTRYCHGTPSKDRTGKKHLNEYAAHPSQSLSVMIIDEAVFDFWLEYQIKQNKVRMKAQVHDEGVFQSRIGTGAELRAKFCALMARPIEVHGRELVIPSDGGKTGYRWGDIKD